MLDKGISHRDIAGALTTSGHTVKVHLWRLFKRLGVKSRSQASHLARTHSLLQSQLVHDVLSEQKELVNRQQAARQCGIARRQVSAA